MPPDVRRTKAAFVIANPKAKLLDQLREVARVKHFSLRTEQTYADWVVRFLRWARDHPHLTPTLSPPYEGAEREKKWRHPRELGAAEVGAFLSHLAVGKGVAVSTQNQALTF